MLRQRVLHENPDLKDPGGKAPGVFFPPEVRPLEEALGSEVSFPTLRWVPRHQKPEVVSVCWGREDYLMLPLPARPEVLAS